MEEEEGKRDGGEGGEGVGKERWKGLVEVDDGREMEMEMERGRR